MEIKKTEIFFKALLHIFILFVLLLSLFWIVISKIQTNLMTDAVKNSLSNVIKNWKSRNFSLKNKHLKSCGRVKFILKVGTGRVIVQKGKTTTKVLIYRVFLLVL